MKLINEKEDGIVISRENRDQVLEHCFLGLVGKFLASNLSIDGQQEILWLQGWPWGKPSKSLGLGNPPAMGQPEKKKGFISIHKKVKNKKLASKGNRTNSYLISQKFQKKKKKNHKINYKWHKTQIKLTNTTQKKKKNCSK